MHRSNGNVEQHLRSSDLSFGIGGGLNCSLLKLGMREALSGYNIKTQSQIID